MTDDDLARITHLGLGDTGPGAGVLHPDVRSGSSFAWPPGAHPASDWPNFRVIWVYHVAPANRAAFVTAISSYETGATLAGATVRYSGTYGVTVSSAAPDFEYRTLWDLADLGALQDLNDELAAAAPGSLLRNWLDLIAPLPAVRTEIMGRIVGSKRATA